MKGLNFIWILTVLIIAGCTSSAPVRAGSIRQQASDSIKEYRIQPGDQLDIKLFYNPELNELLTVRPDGRITMQLINDVIAAGLTPLELTVFLNKAFSAELTNPKVAVIVRTSITDKVYVDGEVNRPGLVVLTGPTTVQQSIAQSGGMKETAKVEQIIVVRKGEDNKMVAIQVNLNSVLQGGDVSQDMILKPNDIVYVPKSTISNVNTWVDLYIRRNVPLPIGLGYTF